MFILPLGTLQNAIQMSRNLNGPVQHPPQSQIDRTPFKLSLERLATGLAMIRVSMAPPICRAQVVAINLQTQNSPDIFTQFSKPTLNERYDSDSYSVSRDRPISNSSCFGGREGRKEGGREGGREGCMLTRSLIILPAGCQGYHHHCTAAALLTSPSAKKDVIP